jgi:ligand-binding SRPBCC domain-containing protein
MPRLVREQWIPRKPEEVFPFFANAANLEAITPPWLGFRILTPAPIRMERGAVIEYRLAWRLFRIRWKTVIAQWEPPHWFLDEQVKGPYKVWRHTHTFTPDRAGTRMTDMVEYELPLGVLGRLAHTLRVRRDLERIFDYRAQQIARLFGGPPGAGA